MNQAKIGITIPDGTPEEQIKHIKNWIEVFKTAAYIVGEEDELDLKSLYEAIEQIKAQDTEDGGENEN